jgi:L-iditol 2-dehydrogenase
LLASILVKPGKIELSEVTTPKPFHGEILVKIEAALTCGTDLKAFLRGHPLMPMPGVFGHEFSGVVTKVGKGVRRFKEGDAVMAVHTAPCLKCAFCKKRLYNLCEKIMAAKVLGAFAEYILLPPHVVKQNAFYKPRKITFEEAAFLEPLSCVVHSVDLLDIKKGDSVLVIGAGPIGLLHLLLLKRRGAKVAVADIKEERIKIAKKLGADYVFRTELSPSPQCSPLRGGEIKGSVYLITPSLRWDKRGIIRGGRVSAGNKNSVKPSPLVGEGKGEGYKYVKEFTDSIGFDYVFECTGKPDVWEDAVNYVRRGGTVIFFGGCESGTTVTYDTGRIHYDEITLKGVFHYTPSDVKKAYKLLCEGSLGVSRLISGRFPLRHTEKALEQLAEGHGIKYVIIP